MNIKMPLRICDLQGHLEVSLWNRLYGIPSDVYEGIHLQDHGTWATNVLVQS